MASSLKLNTYAKINLSLDVRGKRDDGYHEVRTLMHAVELHDEVTVSVEKAERDSISITVDDPCVPTDSTNLAYKAAQVMLSHTRAVTSENVASWNAGQKTAASGSAEKRGVAPVDGLCETGKAGESVPADSCYEIKIDIRKNIPVGAGLAGGSSNAAGVIIALNKLLGMNLGIVPLEHLGEQVGADVPFCVLSTAGAQERVFGLRGETCASGKGKGEIIVPLPSTNLPVVLAKPAASVSTAEVYSELDKLEIKDHPDTIRLLDDILSFEYADMKEFTLNVLENATFRLCPECAELKRLMEVKNGYFTLMSGSGTTIYTLFKSREDAEELAKTLKKSLPDDYTIILTETIRTFR